MNSKWGKAELFSLECHIFVSDCCFAVQTQAGYPGAIELFYPVWCKE